MSIDKKVDGHGRTRYRVYVHDAVAKRKVYVATFDKLKDAEVAEYEAKRRLRLGERLKPREEITFDRLAQRWRKGLVSLRPGTIADYDKALDRIRPIIGSKQVSSLTRRDIDDIIVDLADRYAPSTVRKTVVVLKMVLRMGVDHDYIDRLPMGSSRLPLPKMRKRTFEPLTREQVDRLIACAPPYYQPFYRLLLTSGLRRAEAWGVQREDLDLDKGLVHVRHQLVKGKLVDLKTDAAYRDVPLPRQTIEALRSYLAERPDNELDLVFVTPEGKAVDPPNFYARVWIPTREKAKLPKLRMHDCRHHVASVYLSQGRSIRYVQRLLGHSGALTLLQVYSHVTKDEEARATSDFERWLSEEERTIYRLLRTLAVDVRKKEATTAQVSCEDAETAYPRVSVQE